MRNYKNRNQAYFLAIGIVAVLLVLLLAFSMGWVSNKTTERAEIQEKRGFQLPDGSFVQLNAESKVTFNESTFPERKIIQLDGEALFVVKRGEPFLVKTDYGYIRSYGGQFNVYARTDDFDVTCLLGKIDVIKNDETLPMGNNEQVVWKDGQFLKKPHYGDRPDWTYFETTFIEESFSKAVDEIERQYGIKIILDITGNPPFTGGIPHQELQSAIDNLVDPFGYKYEQNGSVLKIWEP